MPKLFIIIVIYLMLTFVTYKWYINNLTNTMIVKITTILIIANLSQPDTLIQQQTQNIIKIWHIVVNKKLKSTHQLP